MPTDDELRAAAADASASGCRRLGAIGELVGFLWVDELDVDPALLVPEALGRGDDPRGPGRSPGHDRGRSARSPSRPTSSSRRSAPLAEARGWKAGDLFMAIRVAVTGRTATPPLFDTLVALGRERTLERLDRALAVLGRLSPRLSIAVMSRAMLEVPARPDRSGGPAWKP